MVRKVARTASAGGAGCGEARKAAGAGDVVGGSAGLARRLADLVAGWVLVLDATGTVRASHPKAAADRARSGAAKLAFWMTASLLFGAFAASLAAVEGGQHRDGTWNDRRLVSRAW